jgi:hypothetical protein
MARKDMTYAEASHAMQSGVAFDQAKGSRDGEPKHLRVGINSAAASQEGLARLLIEKGLITEAEYTEAIRQAMVREVERYEHYLATVYGIKVTLG